MPLQRVNSGHHRDSVTYNAVGHLICSVMVVPVRQLFQTIWSLCVHCCPRRNVLSPLDISGQQSLDLRSCHSLTEGLFCLSNVEISAVLAALDSLN